MGPGFSTAQALMTRPYRVAGRQGAYGPSWCDTSRGTATDIPVCRAPALCRTVLCRRRRPLDSGGDAPGEGAMDQVDRDKGVGG
jgi:hypothetical protein